jgi:hypothetical protein
MRRDRKAKAVRSAAEQAAYKDLMGSPQDAADHPVNTLPAPAGGEYRGVLSPFANDPTNQTDPFNQGA